MSEGRRKGRSDNGLTNTRCFKLAIINIFYINNQSHLCESSNSLCNVMSKWYGSNAEQYNSPSKNTECSTESIYSLCKWNSAKEH